MKYIIAILLICSSFTLGAIFGFMCFDLILLEDMNLTPVLNKLGLFGIVLVINQVLLNIKGKLNG